MNAATPSTPQDPLPPHRIEIHQDARKRTWWSEHKAPCVIAASGKIAWATLATAVHEHADEETAAYRDACAAHGLNAETGLHPDGQPFEVFINGTPRAPHFPDNQPSAVSSPVAGEAQPAALGEEAAS